MKDELVSELNDYKNMRWIVTGPESCGKTTLTEYLINNLDIKGIPEYARIFLSDLNRPYIQEDLDKIARQQIIEWNECKDRSAIYDTDILTTIIWYLERYRHIPSYMMDQWLAQDNSIYLLCNTELSWQPDPLRENPDDRDRLFKIYFHFLNAYGKSFKIVKGVEQSRLTDTLDFIRKVEGKGY
jgi:nicotinamide riboside kinase